MIYLTKLIKQDIESLQILNKKIKNPKTGNLIKISSALTYPENYEVYKIAKNMLDNKTISPNKVDSNLNNNTGKVNSLKDQLHKLLKTEKDDKKKDYIQDFLKEYDEVDKNNIKTKKNKIIIKKLLKLQEDININNFYGDGEVLKAKYSQSPDKQQITTFILTQDAQMHTKFYYNNMKVHLDYFAKNPIAPPGTAARILNNQIQQFKQIGMNKITLEASGWINDRAFNGYYTWARLGFNFQEESDLNLLKFYLEKQEDPQLKSVKTLPELMSFQKGRKFWKEKGFSFKGYFDLNDDSQGMMILKKYMEQK